MVNPKPLHPAKLYRRNTFVYPTLKEVCVGLALAAVLIVGANYLNGSLTF